MANVFPFQITGFDVQFYELINWVNVGIIQLTLNELLTAKRYDVIRCGYLQNIDIYFGVTL